MSLYLTLISIVLLAPSCLGSHFRGGYFTWIPTEQQSQIKMSYRLSWRRSYSSNHYCNSSHSSSDELRPGEGSLICSQGCNGIVTDLAYRCTDFSETEDWTTGTRTFLYNLTTSSPDISLIFSGCCWINLQVRGGSSWSMKAKALVGRRKDTGKINSSPSTSIQPIVRVQYGCNSTINLLVSDPDGDIVRCRWSNGSDECDSTCSSFPGAFLNEDTCTLSYQATTIVGYYGVAIQVEDFPITGEKVPYSSVPLQFLVDVYSVNQGCYNLPEFIAPTRADQEIVYVTVEKVYFDQIVAISNVPNKRIVEITTVSPHGFVKSALEEYPDVPGSWYINMTWTPSASTANAMHILCFTATDEMKLTSKQRCINLIVSPNIEFNGSNGLEFQYGPLFKDDFMRIQNEKCILVSKEYEFPMFHSVHSKIYVCVTGIVTFDEAFESPGTVNGSNLKGRAILAPYFTDIDKESLRYEGNVYYHVYNVLQDDIKNVPNIKTAEDIIRNIHRDVANFQTHFALFVTWRQVLPSMAGSRLNERMNFQLALVTDGIYTFAFYVYNQMKFRGEEVYIGFAAKDGQQYMDYRSFTSAVRSIDTKAKSYGYMGLLHYRLTFPSPGKENTRQRCINWFLNERENKTVYDKALEGMPLCPCNPSQLNEDMFYRNNDCFSHGESLCAYILPNWQFDPRDSGKTCCYDKTQSFFLGSGTNAGGFIRYHPHRNALKHKTDDLDMRNVCCVQNDLCSLYHSVRPIGACYNIFPAWHAPARGDPHIKTLDGYTYTFNGWGEFTLVKINSSSEEFELQARTTRAMRHDGNTSDATLFSAFAARDKHGANVHVEMNTAKNGLIIYARMSSGSMLNDYTSDYMDFTKDFNIVSDYLSLSRTCRIKDLRVVFSSGIAFTVGIAVNMLNIDVIIPNKFRRMTSGLMGNFDDKQENDLQLKNGTILFHNTTERHIFEFGMTWAIEANQSAFWYPRGKGYFDYSHLNYTPKFLEDADQVKVATAKQFCGSEEEECIFDLVFTGNEAVANHTKSLGNTSRNTEKILANHVPSISGPKKVNITANETLTYRLNATDDGTFTYKVLNGHPYANIILQTNGEALLTLFFKETDPVNIVVTVVDNFGVQATPHQPTMVYCSNCSRRGTCDFEDYRDDNRTTSTFKYATCKCGPYWDGPECEFDKDGCATHPCSPLRNCTDIPADIHQVSGIGYNCSECPKGFISTNDGRCEDINECTADGVCTQICNNTYGSYTCSCFQGFQKPDDSDICQDINECDSTMNVCDQTCNNTIGGYYCSCYKGFVFNNQTRTCEAVGNPSSGCSNLDCSSTAGCILDEHDIPRCFCRKGFQLNLDGRICVDIDECQLAPCQHTCTNTNGSFYCSCFNGNSLEENKVSCKPCESPTYGQNCNETCECEHGAIRCDNVKGCICSEGWTGKHCQEDVDECQIPNICNDSYKMCQNTNGSFLCYCVKGYTLNTNGSCQDVDECRNPDLNTCQHICHNEAGGFSCSCFPGYVQKKNNTNMCQDIDECVTGQSGCNQICQNSDGRYTCDCYSGYILNTDRKTCKKVEDPCSAHNHKNCSQICVFEKQEVFCSCFTGYRLSSDNQTCEDINECGDNISNRCSNNCTNIDGGYICSCPDGYQLDNDERTCIGCDAFHYGSNCSNLCNCGIGADKCDPIKGCLCKPGWNGTNCDTDIDECLSHPCTGDNVQCINTMGSNVCDCVRGYRIINGVCQDIDECIDPRLNECDQTCMNAAGSYSCLCYEGFLSDGTTCHDLSKCIESSYGCACYEGFRLSERDYHTCIPCSNNTFGLNCSHLCSCNISNSLTVNQTCDRINGTCFCKEGWMGSDCSQDINECEFEPAPCQKIENAGCYNMEGSFKCLCHLGYKPDGNDGCVEDLQQIRTPIPIEAPACSNNTFGLNCSHLCSCNISNSLTVNQTCDRINGTCFCKEGWMGSDCSQDINECEFEPAPCQKIENAGCYNMEGSFKCLCHLGYKPDGNDGCVEDLQQIRTPIPIEAPACSNNTFGLNCSHLCSCNISNSLTVNQTCDRINGTCFCKEGWMGSDCSQDINECEFEPAPCQKIENAGCYNMEGSFKCLCHLGYKPDGNDGCVEDLQQIRTPIPIEAPACSNNTFGLNCSHLCSCNISNSLTVNQTCDRINGTCFCKEGWMGSDCSQDINECEFEPAPCQKIENAGCYNMEGSFKCLCHLGYKPDGNDGCVEDLQQIRTPIPIEAPAGYTSITISVTLNFKMPASLDIRVLENYAKLEIDAQIAITELYTSRMGQMFEQIVIHSIRQGSLIVNYSIIVKKSDETLLKLAEANADLATGKITLAGQECTALGLTVGDKQLLTGGPSSDILCNSYLSVTGECGSGSECVISNTKPGCSPKKNKDDTDVYVATGIGAALFVVLCLVTAVVIIRCRRPVGKKVPVEDRSNSGPEISQKWNHEHSKTDEDTPNWIYYAHRNDIYHSTHHEDASNRYVDSDLLANRDFSEREAIGMHHYMPSPSHEYAEIPPMEEYPIKRPKVYGLVNRAYENQM